MSTSDRVRVKYSKQSKLCKGHREPETLGDCDTGSRDLDNGRRGERSSQDVLKGPGSQPEDLHFLHLRARPELSTRGMVVTMKPSRVVARMYWVVGEGGGVTR